MGGAVGMGVGAIADGSMGVLLGGVVGGAIGAGIGLAMKRAYQRNRGE